MTLSKKEAFLNNNAILRKELEEDVTDWQPYTKVTLNSVLDEKKDGNFFSAMSLENIVFELKHHFLARLCESRINLPTIELVRFEDILLIDKLLSL